MSHAFEQIQQGLQEAIAHAHATANGCPQGARTSHPKPVDIRAMRSGMGMTQEQFASRFGFSAAALRHWERGDRTPRGPARVLLNVIAHDPQAVIRALAADRT